ncbi:MAG: alpha/beta hydrolase [Proteobacteria bacterium]|nr:MAG: alpha/beta hydrolase [Pseudomonadota bacterium]
MRERTVQCASAHGLHQMAYTEWGDPANPKVLLCVHGLTRNGRDFDFLAAALADEYRVVCPDVVGRGRSEWLAIKAGYGFPQYVADMVTLIARLDVPTVHWVGTSMGGLIGMILAALPGSPITRMVLNDVGPKITVESIHRIAEYVGAAPVFANLDDAERYIREVSAPFGPLTDAQWRHLTAHAVSAVDGGVAMVYDPGIAETFRESPLESDVDLWDVYDAIRCPTLVIRGAESDLLLHETAQEMSQRGPKATLVEFEGIGHAPMLLDPAQIEVVRRFLLADAGA